MSPTPKKRAADTPGVQAAPTPIQAVMAPTPNVVVDFTDQASFQQGVDSSPYATAKGAKRASKALGKGGRYAKGKVAKPKAAASAPAAARIPAVVPGTLVLGNATAKPPAVPGSPSYANLHVVGAGSPYDAAAVARSQQAERARQAAGKTFRPPTPVTRRPETDLEQPLGAPVTPGGSTAQASESFTVIESPRAAQAGRPSAGSANIARPKPSKPAPAPAARPVTAGRADAAANPAGRPRVLTADRPAPAAKPLSQRVAGLLARLNTEATWRRATVFATVVGCMLFTTVTLFEPAQQLYVAIRQNERLINELAMNQQRVAALEASVSSLQTAEGVQDLAHETWGLVLPGEVYVNVHNASGEAQGSPVPAEIKRGSGQNTTNWITDLLDRVFVPASAVTNAVDEKPELATLTESGR